jgi:hypothetical protein
MDGESTWQYPYGFVVDVRREARMGCRTELRCARTRILCSQAHPAGRPMKGYEVQVEWEFQGKGKTVTKKWYPARIIEVGIFPSPDVGTMWTMQ